MRIRGRAGKGVVDVTGYVSVKPIYIYGQYFPGLNAETRNLIHDGLKILASYDLDGARVQNGMGFNKQDTATGNYLASCEPPLKQDEAARGWIIIRKYHRQIPEIVKQLRERIGQ